MSDDIEPLLLWVVKAASYCGILDFIVSRHATSEAANIDLQHQIETQGSENISTKGR